MFTKIHLSLKASNSFILLFSCLFVFCACSHKPINYYLLEIPQESSNHIQNSQNNNTLNTQSLSTSIPTNINLSGPIIALSQVILPQYLNRPQIVTRNNSIDFSINDDNRWGEELSAGIARVLCNSLSKNLANIGATSSPLRIGLSPDYVINLEITSFEGTLNGELRLRALWTLDTSASNKNHKKSRRNNETSNLWQAFFDQSIATGDSYASYVLAYSTLIDSLGAEISRVFLNVYSQARKTNK